MTSAFFTFLLASPNTSMPVTVQVGIERADLEDIWAKSDFITVHTPLTKETNNLIDDATIAKCKEGVRIVNCARGVNSTLHLISSLHDSTAQHSTANNLLYLHCGILIVKCHCPKYRYHEGNILAFYYFDLSLPQLPSACPHPASSAVPPIPFPVNSTSSIELHIPCKLNPTSSTLSMSRRHRGRGSIAQRTGGKSYPITYFHRLY